MTFSEANEIGLEQFLKNFWRAALHRYFDETMHAPATVAAYLAYPCTRTDLQMRCKPATELSEGGSPSNWLKQGACLASSCGMEGHVCGTGHCLNTPSEQLSQLAKLSGRLSMSDKSEMELFAGCHGVTEINLITALGFCSMTSSIESFERVECEMGWLRP